jgi:hypothetical protein
VFSVRQVFVTEIHVHCVLCSIGLEFLNIFRVYRDAVYWISAVPVMAFSIQHVRKAST